VRNSAPLCEAEDASLVVSCSPGRPLLLLPPLPLPPLPRPLTSAPVAPRKTRSGKVADDGAGAPAGGGAVDAMTDGVRTNATGKNRVLLFCCSVCVGTVNHLLLVHRGGTPASCTLPNSAADRLAVRHEKQATVSRRSERHGTASTCGASGADGHGVAPS